MKLSIIIAVFQSHEIVRRQLLHFKHLGIPSQDLELIIVDDGSNPPIPGATLRTNNKLAWTQGQARNLGANAAKGDYLFFTDIDHILSFGAVHDAYNFSGNKMIFRRQIAILDEDGNIRQDPATLRDWGYEKEKLDASVHGNTFVISRDQFMKLGGYDKSATGYHPITKKGDDCLFNAKWNKANRGVELVVGSDIYMFPIGRFRTDGDLNPKGLFHDLSQVKQERFYKYA